MNPANTGTYTGNLIADPEHKQTSKGNSSCKVALSVYEKQIDGQHGSQILRFVAYGDTADNILKRCQKGTNVTFHFCEFKQWEHQGKHYNNFVIGRAVVNRNGVASQGQPATNQQATGYQPPAQSAGYNPGASANADEPPFR